VGDMGLWWKGRNEESMRKCTGVVCASAATRDGCVVSPPYDVVPLVPSNRDDLVTWGLKTTIERE